MLVFPNAKINIGLRVTGKRADGYHTIETILYPIPLCDILEFVESDNIPEEKFQFTSSGIELIGCTTGQNLCIKALELLSEHNSLPKLKIHLHKKIPSGAGLGGGSSDASFMLKTLNAYLKLNISDAVLEKYAAKLGSDCAFFIRNKPAYAEEKGDVLSPALISLRGYHIVVIHPGIHVSTADAYANVILSQHDTTLPELIKEPVTEWKEYIFNDFESSVFQKHPEINIIKENLYNAGAEYASMSGSGSAVFGLFDDLPDLKDLFPADYFIWQGIL